MTIYRLENNGRTLVYRVNTGSKGADGLSSYLHIAYATDDIGTGFNFKDGTYLGLYIDNYEESSEDPSSYSWHKMTGDQGPQGIAGPSVDLTIGEVAGGDTADATITGTSPNLVLNLTLPKGEKGEKGDQGLEGPQGEVGPAPNLSIGTVQSGASASATIDGTSPNYTLNLTLPKGDKGDQGEQGLKGDKGEQGPAGEQGPKGNDGVSAGFGTPTASVSTLEAGSSATVSVQASGENTSKVFAFTFGIPRGNAGPKGDKGDVGSQGPKGDDGYTPVKGTDYWTEEDISSIETDLKAYVDTEIGQINTVLDAINGEVI